MICESLPATGAWFYELALRPGEDGNLRWFVAGGLNLRRVMDDSPQNATPCKRSVSRTRRDGVRTIPLRPTSSPLPTVARART